MYIYGRHSSHGESLETIKKFVQLQYSWDYNTLLKGTIFRLEQSFIHKLRNEKLILRATNSHIPKPR